MLHSPINGAEQAQTIQSKKTATKVMNFGRKSDVDAAANARTAGRIPVLKNLGQTAKSEITSRISENLNENTSETSLSYGPTKDITPKVEEEKYSFYDVLDVVNPLQHIPVVGTLYRAISGDEIKPASKIIGSAVYGGPVGAAVSAADFVIEHETGRDMTGNVVALLAGDTIKQNAFYTPSPETLLSHPQIRLSLAYDSYNNAQSIEKSSYHRLDV